MKCRHILCILLAFGLLGPTAQASADGITIGLAAPLSGPYAEWGAQVRHGVERAVADINASGGVLGQQLRLEIADDEGKAARAERAARDLVSDDAVFVVGHFFSAASIAAAPIYYTAGVLQITPSSSNPELTDESAAAGRKTLFRMCNRDDQQGYFAGRWLAEHYTGKRIAIVDDRTPYGRLISDWGKKGLNAGGLREVVREEVDADEDDYGDLVMKLVGAEIDALYFGGYHPGAARILKQMREAGLKAAMFGADSQQPEEFAKLAGTASDGVMFTSNPDVRKLASAKKAADAIRSEGFEPEGYTLLAYAAVQVWALAANKSGSTDANDVAAALRGQAWDTVIGPLSFDAKGDLVKQIFTWLVFKNGKYGEAGL